jgi:ribosome maturation factor RimP
MADMERNSATKQLGVEAQVTQVAAPFLEQQGYDLVMVEFAPRNRVLRFYVDRSSGVSLDDCARVSRVLGDLLDAEGISDLLPGRYVLEVSSPGLDRPLTRPKDFQRFIGQRVRLAMREPIDGQKKFVGELLAATEMEIQINANSRVQTIHYGQIEKARLVPEW